MINSCNEKVLKASEEQQQLILQKNTEYTSCGKKLFGNNSTAQNLGNVICEMRYGSFIKDQSMLTLDWSNEPIDGQTFTCSTGSIPHCTVVDVVTSKRQTVSAYLGLIYPKKIL